MQTLALRLSIHGIAHAVNRDNAIVADGFTRIVCKPDDMNEHVAGRNPPGMVERRVARTMRKMGERRKRRVAQVRKWVKAHLGVDVDALSGQQKTAVILHRERGIKEVLSAEELALVLLTAAKRRGWKLSADDDDDELGEFLATVEANSNAATEAGGIGAYQAGIYRTGKRVRTRSYFREVHEAELVRIAQVQAPAYACMQGEPLAKLRRIIFFQRPLKSMKGKVDRCQYEKDRPVCNKLNPWFQTFRVYCDTENIRVWNAYGNDMPIGDVELAAVREALLSGKDLTALRLLKLLGYDKGDAVTINYEKGLQGHQTRKLIPNSQHLSDVELECVWQVLHSVKDPQGRMKGIDRLVSITDDGTWAELKLPKMGYGSYSQKAIRKMLPHLEAGKDVRAARRLAGYDKARKDDEVELRGMNLVAKKWFDHVVNHVKRIEAAHGRMDRIVLATESMLVAARKTRARMASEKRAEQKLLKQLVQEIHETIGPRTLSRKDEQRLLLWHECNGVSPLEPEAPITLKELVDGKGANAITVDHVVPLSRLFDDGPMNKVLCRQKTNKAKGDLTALEYIRKAGVDEERYTQLVGELTNAAGKHLPLPKQWRLKTDQENIPRNFVTRKLPRGPFVRATHSAFGADRVLWCPIAVAGHLVNRWQVPLKGGDLGNHITQAWALSVVTEEYFEKLDALTDHPGEHGRHIESPTAADGYQRNIRMHHYRRSSFRGKGGRMEPKVALHQDTHYGRIAPLQWMDRAKMPKGAEVAQERGDKVQVRVPEVVVRYAVQSLVAKDLAYVVDPAARGVLTDHLKKYGNDAEKAWANYDEDPPLFMGNAIRHVRLYTKLSKVKSIKGGQYIVKEGIIDHLAVYQDEKGRMAFAASSPLDVAARMRAGEPLTPPTHPEKGELLRVVRYGEVFELDGEPHYVNTIDGDSGRVGLLPVMRASKEPVSMSLRKLLVLESVGA